MQDVVGHSRAWLMKRIQLEMIFCIALLSFMDPYVL